MLTGKRPIFASRSAIRVVQNALAIFLKAWFCIFSSGLLCDFCPIYHTSEPKSTTIVMQLW
jgi:hypothetical protein